MTPDPGAIPHDVAEARISAGEAYRELGHAFAAHDGDPELLDGMARSLTEIAERLRNADVRHREIERPRGDWGPAPADGTEMLSHGERPISGRAAPLGLGVRVFRDGDEAVGRITFGPAHEGAPGRCHGGLVSALFDDVFGFLLSLTQQPAFTGTLTVRYEAGAPIGEPLECRVRVDGIEGRKMLLSGELTSAQLSPTDDASADHAPTTYVRSTAIFITIPSISYTAPNA